MFVEFTLQSFLLLENHSHPVSGNKHHIKINKREKEDCISAHSDPHRASWQAENKSSLVFNWFWVWTSKHLLTIQTKPEDFSGEVPFASMCGLDFKATASWNAECPVFWGTKWFGSDVQVGREVPLLVHHWSELVQNHIATCLLTDKKIPDLWDFEIRPQLNFGYKVGSHSWIILLFTITAYATIELKVQRHETSLLSKLF